MKYKFKYRRALLWKTVVVVGHNWDQHQDKMVLFYENGSIEEIAKWSDCSAKLGVDWVLAQKKSLEKQAGQPISLAVEG